MQIDEATRKKVRLVTVVTAFMTTFMSSALNLSIPDISAEFGVSAGTVGWIVTAYTLTVAAFCVPMGRLADKVPAYKLASAWMGFCVLTLIWYTLTLQKTSTVYIVIALILGGMGFALFSSPNNNAIMSRVHPEERGTGNAIVSTMRTVGQSFSMCAVTIIVNIRLGDVSLQAAGAENLTQQIRICFVIFAGICAAGTVISMARGRERRSA